MLLPLVAQARVITGTVTDPSGETIISASVMVKGSTIGTVTDFDGNYSREVPEGSTTLVFSYIGMQTVERPINADWADNYYSLNRSPPLANTSS